LQTCDEVADALIAAGDAQDAAEAGGAGLGAGHLALKPPMPSQTLAVLPSHSICPMGQGPGPVVASVVSVAVTGPVVPVLLVPVVPLSVALMLPLVVGVSLSLTLAWW
jgi:hypothetical protein